jgi:hypothetical protein
VVVKCARGVDPKGRQGCEGESLRDGNPKRGTAPAFANTRGGECGSGVESKALKTQFRIGANASGVSERQESSKVSKGIRLDTGEKNSEGENPKGAWI